MSVFKPTYAYPIPEGAQIHKTNGQKYINLKDHNGRTVKAFLTKDEKNCLRFQRNWAGRYNDYNGQRRTIMLCQEKEASQAALNELVKYIELLRANRTIPPLNEISPVIREKVQEALRDSGQETKGDQLSRKPLKNLFAMYIEHLEASGTTKAYRTLTEKYLEVIAAECNFQFLKDICQAPVKSFINRKKESGLSDRTVNVYVDKLRYFCNWAYENHLLSQNPFAGFRRLDEKTNRVREARSLTPEEVETLLDASMRRPLAQRQEKYKKIKAGTIQKLNRLGEERRLSYALMLYTGLRVNEARQLIWDDIDLDKQIMKVRASIAKNSKGVALPIHGYLEGLLKDWRAKHKEAHLNDRVVNIPESNSSFLKAFDRDLEFAGIEKKDELGRVVHLHGLRHTFASLLARQGVHPHVLQRLARHSNVQTTMGFYTHILHGDDVSAIESLQRPKTKAQKGKKKRAG